MPLVYDEALNQLIRQRLTQDKRTAGVTVDSHCSEGCICLMGRVDSIEQKEAAEFLVEGMIGVRSVQNMIVVRDLGS